MKRLSRVRDQRGAALIEFSLVFPIVFLVLIGVLSMLWLFAAKSALTGAAREGVRYASIRHDRFDCDLVCDPAHPYEAQYPTEEQVSVYVNDVIDSFGPVDVTLTPHEADGALFTGRVPNSPVSVEVSRPLPVIFKQIGSLFGWHELQYSSETQVRAE
jgi:Flp pilus assembly pilin Flp